MTAIGITKLIYPIFLLSLFGIAAANLYSSQSSNQSVELKYRSQNFNLSDFDTKYVRVLNIFLDLAKMEQEIAAQVGNILRQQSNILAAEDVTGKFLKKCLNLKILVEEMKMDFDNREPNRVSKWKNFHNSLSKQLKNLASSATKMFKKVAEDDENYFLTDADHLKLKISLTKANELIAELKKQIFDPVFNVSVDLINQTPIVNTILPECLTQERIAHKISTLLSNYIKMRQRSLDKVKVSKLDVEEISNEIDVIEKTTMKISLLLDDAQKVLEPQNLLSCAIQTIEISNINVRNMEANFHRRNNKLHGERKFVNDCFYGLSPDILSSIGVSFPSEMNKKKDMREEL